MDRARVSMADLARDPVREGAGAIEPVLEWYAAYKRLVRGRPDGTQLVREGRDWLIDAVSAALDAEDALDPLPQPPSAPRRR